MTITKYEDVFELLTDERLAVIEDMNIEDLKETICQFAFLASMIGEIEVIRQLVPIVNDTEDREILRDTFAKGKEGAMLALGNFVRLTST